MSRLLTLSKKLVLPALAAALLFASPAMAGGLVAHDSPHPVSVGGGSSQSGGSQGGGGGSQLSDMKLYQPAQADDPGHKLNLLKANDKPLYTDGFLARDPGKTGFLWAMDAHGKLVKIPIPVKDIGAAYEAWLALPSCGPHSGMPCVYRVNLQHGVGHKPNALADDKPLNTSSYVAKDPGHKLNLLKANDKPLYTDGFLGRDPGKTNLLHASDTPHHVKLVMPVKDVGPDHNLDMHIALMRAYEATLPTCGPDTPFGVDCTYR